MSRALSAAGYADRLLRGGATARPAGRRKRRYGLVILDLIMPDMDGRSVLTELILRRQPEQPVLVLSCLEDVRDQGRPAWNLARRTT